MCRFTCVPFWDLPKSLLHTEEFRFNCALVLAGGSRPRPPKGAVKRLPTPKHHKTLLCRFLFGPFSIFSSQLPTNEQVGDFPQQGDWQWDHGGEGGRFAGGKDTGARCPAAPTAEPCRKQSLIRRGGVCGHWGDSTTTSKKTACHYYPPP